MRYDAKFDKFTIDKKESLSFMSKYVDLNDEWVGRHLFVDPYPLPKQDIALRIFDRMEAYLLSMNRRASLPAD